MSQKETRIKLLRISQVLEIVPIAKSTWWKWVASGKAPKPTRIGRCTFWKELDIIDFIKNSE